MTSETCPSNLAQLGPAVRSTYQRALRGEGIGPEDAGFDTLVDLGLIIPDPLTPGQHVPAALDQVEEQLRVEGAARLSAAVGYMEAIPSLLADLSSEHRRSGRKPHHAEIVYLQGLERVHAVMARIVDSARSEIHSAHPGQRPKDLVARSLPRDVKLAERGVRLRTIYHPNNRRVRSVHEWARTMAMHGSQVRTLSAPFLKCVIVDDRHAFISDFIEGADVTQSAWHVQHPAMVAWIREVFQQTWERATPWETNPPQENIGPSGASTSEGPRMTTPETRAILRGLCAGWTHQQIGQSLGLSERTVTKRLSELRERIGLATNAQLTYWWAFSRERHLDEVGSD